MLTLLLYDQVTGSRRPLWTTDGITTYNRHLRLEDHRIITDLRLYLRLCNIFRL